MTARTTVTDAELDAMEEPHGLALAEQLIFLFEEEGLPLPPLPEHLVPQLEIVRPWLFGSREDVAGAYDIEGLVAEAPDQQPGDYVLFGQDGHGVNSTAMHYHLVSGHLALFVQVPWGGIYMDRDERNAAVAAAFAGIERLIETVRATEGRLAARGQQLVVVASGWHGDRWALVRRGEPPVWFRAVDALAVARRALGA